MPNQFSSHWNPSTMTLEEYKRLEKEGRLEKPVIGLRRRGASGKDSAQK